MSRSGFVLSTCFHFQFYFLVWSVPLFKPLCFLLSLFTNPRLCSTQKDPQRKIATLHQMGTSGDNFLQVLFKNFDVLALYGSCPLHLYAWMPLYDVDSHEKFKLFLCYIESFWSEICVFAFCSGRWSPWFTLCKYSFCFLNVTFWKKCVRFWVVSVSFGVCGRYASIKAIESRSSIDDQQWLTYWVLYSLITLFELTFSKVLEV